MRKSWKGAAALVALLSAPTVAHAHAFTCEKTASVNGGTPGAAVAVDAYPATVTYTYTITNTHPTEVSIIQGLIDPMFPEGIGIALPFPIPVGGSTSASKTLPIASYADCVALANATAGGPVTLTNTLTVVFDGQPAASCSAQVICQPPPTVEGCLTRTPGYWGTHPNVTEMFLPVTSLGLELGSVVAGQQGSIIEDLCSTGTDAAVYGSPQEAQLVRQCAAAALNMAASEALGGSCGDFASRFAACCSSCGAPVEGCIEDLDRFNSSEDTLLDGGNELELCHVLELPCKALPEACQEARGNGFVNDRANAIDACAAGEGAPGAGGSGEVAAGGGSGEGAASASELRTGSDVNRPSGGCGGGPGGLLALLALVPLLRRRR